MHDIVTVNRGRSSSRGKRQESERLEQEEKRRKKRKRDSVFINPKSVRYFWYTIFDIIISTYRHPLFSGKSSGGDEVTAYDSGACWRGLSTNGDAPL